MPISSDLASNLRTQVVQSLEDQCGDKDVLKGRILDTLVDNLQQLSEGIVVVEEVEFLLQCRLERKDGNLEKVRAMLIKKLGPMLSAFIEIYSD